MSRRGRSTQVFDAFSAIRLIEEFGEQLEHDRSLGLDGNASPLRTDLCECHNVIKCPNGTSSPIGASSLNDCKPCCSGVAGESPEMCYTSETTTCRKTGSAMVLRRYDLIPSHAVDDYNATNFVIKAPVDASEEIKVQLVLQLGVSRGRSEVRLAPVGRLYQRDVVSEFEPKTWPRCRDSETR